MRNSKVMINQKIKLFSPFVISQRNKSGERMGRELNQKRKRVNYVLANPLISLEPTGGFEPPTC